jgi:hypothetical protein
VRGQRTEAIINSVIAAHVIANIMQVLKNNTVPVLWSCHRRKQSQCREGVPCCSPVFWLEIWRGTVKVKVLQRWKGAAESDAQYTKGTPENRVF